jgi:hypothetical protein
VVFVTQNSKNKTPFFAHTDCGLILETLLTKPIYGDGHQNKPIYGVWNQNKPISKSILASP